MAAPEIIAQLSRRFNDNLPAYRSGSYNEAQLRLEFLNPFFEALGWDVANRQGYSEAYKEVIVEQSIQVSEQRKAPDYTFRIGRSPVFYVEAKKPSVNLKDDISPAYQLRRYAWSSKLALSILTDFEEFAVYDCRGKPDKSDKASTGRLMYLRFNEYSEKWDEIAAIFSRGAVLQGSFDRYAESAKGKRGTADVDDAFLEEIECWRTLLARNIALRNGQLTQRQLNYAVQMTIDRLIFLRICEDRDIEPYEQLKELLHGEGLYSGLTQLFRQADSRYNSGLFHFKTEKDQADDPDTLTLGLKIDDRPLKEIIQNLYYPDSPYAFSLMPAEILGQVYERFLGKVIRLTAGHHAVIEDKPEVKKAGGVYYTPSYIVEYIVKHTVGALLEGKKPGEQGVGQGEPLRVLDPACGSGSFLLGAYQYLLDWYREGYAASGTDKWSRGRNPALVQAAGGEWRLTVAERKRILLAHIYGVDIDPQAVEVTKLSLLLKVLEGESEQTLGQLSLFKERALPDLGKNVKCGNSLIGPDFYQGKQMGLLDPEEQYRINAFDWQAEFADVFRGYGGFDGVIGNPPYIRIQALKEWAPLEIEFYKQHYTSASKGNYDIYVVFVEKGVNLVNKYGQLGFILPHKFFNSQYGQPLRQYLANGRYLSKIVHFGDQQVFSGATTYTCLMFLNKAKHESIEIEKVDDLYAWRTNSQSTKGYLVTENITSNPWNFTVGKGVRLFEKLNNMPVKLGGITDRIAQGIRTSANEVYILDLISDNNDILLAHSDQLGKNVVLNRETLNKFLLGREIKRFHHLHSGKVAIIPYHTENRKSTLISQHEFRDKYPLTFQYLLENKTYLENRENGRMKNPQWYAFIYPKNIEIMRSAKILVPDIADRSQFALDEYGEFAFTSGYGITIGSKTQISLKFVIGLLNSKLLDYYLKCISTPMQNGFFRYFSQFIEQLPIPTLDYAEAPDTEIYNHMVLLVDNILHSQNQLTVAQTPSEKTLLQRQIDAIDREIDNLVYELYGLTDEEIKIVEDDK